MQEGKREAFHERLRREGAETRAVRNRTVLDAACGLATLSGLASVKRVNVAQAAGVSCGTVSAAFEDMDGLRRAVMTRAVELGLLKILAEGLALGDPIARAAPDDLKTRALATLS